MKANKKDLQQLDQHTSSIDSRGVSEEEWSHLSKIIAARLAKKSTKKKSSKSQKPMVRYDLLMDNEAQQLSLVSEPEAVYLKTKKKSSGKSARKSAKKSRKKS